MYCLRAPRLLIAALTLSLGIALSVVENAAAAERDYGLVPGEVAPGVYVLEGAQEHFNFRNGGNIVNTGFIVGDDGVVVIDTGPSRLYGEAMRKAIATVTDKPVHSVYITHFHPDHMLGNQAFRDVPIYALPHTVEGMQVQGELFNDAMYRLVGAWMKGTELVLPMALKEVTRIAPAGRELQLLRFAGHSGADLAILDTATGVMFAGDLVFHNRTPTTPHADVPLWIDELASLREFSYTTLVPGHGPVVQDHRAIDQTALYLDWLYGSLYRAAEAGVSMAEALEPDSSGAAYFSMAVFRDEYQRSVAHLYPSIEQAVIARGSVVQREP